MKIVFIGSGNVARSLGKLLAQAGHQIIQVMSRSIEHARSLAEEWGAGHTSNYHQILPDADIYIVAISDKALPELMLRWQMENRLVVHTAGTVSMNVLGGISSKIGVLYPLQSLRGELPASGTIPFLLTASGDAELDVLKGLVSSTGSSYQLVSDQQRLHMHVAAVWINNFPNLMYSIAYRHCAEQGLSFELLHPLLLETVLRLKPSAGEKTPDPFQFQTGPAIRSDQPTLRKHLDIMSRHPDWKDLYQQLSEEIVSLAAQDQLR